MSDIPSTWTRGYRGVMPCYTSPSGKQWICANWRGQWDWQTITSHGKTVNGNGEYITNCLTQMARMGYIEGEFE